MRIIKVLVWLASADSTKNFVEYYCCLFVKIVSERRTPSGHQKTENKMQYG